MPRLRPKVLAIVLLLLGTFATQSMGSARADSVLEQVVSFGLHRSGIGPYVEFEALCHVTTSYEALTLRDGASVSSFLATQPGGCGLALYLLGVRLPLPLPLQTPLGSLSFSLPNVLIYTIGLVDVAIALTVTLQGGFSGDRNVLSAAPRDIEWTTWGSVPTTLAAHAGVRGSTLAAQATLRLTLLFTILVSVRAFGAVLFEWNTTLAAMEGRPTVQVPAFIDLLPNPSSIMHAVAPSPYLLEVAWTRNGDSDFARYEVVLTSGGAQRTIVVGDPSQTSLFVPAKPSTTYTVHVVVYDEGGQRAFSRSVSVTTPRPRDPGFGDPLGGLLDPHALLRPG